MPPPSKAALKNIKEKVYAVTIPLSLTPLDIAFMSSFPTWKYFFLLSEKNKNACEKNSRQISLNLLYMTADPFNIHLDPLESVRFQNFGELWDRVLESTFPIS